MSLEIFRNLDADNWHWGLLALLSSGYRISFTLHQLHQQQKEARTGYCLDWTFSNNLWSDYKGKISNFLHDSMLINIAWRNWTVSLLLGPQGKMVYVGWSGDARCLVFTGERCQSACVASHLSSLFQSRIVQSAEDWAVTGELYSTKIDLCKCALDAFIAARYYPVMLWRLKELSQLTTTTSTTTTTNTAQPGQPGEEHSNNLDPISSPSI